MKSVDEVEKNKKEEAHRNHAKLFTLDILSGAIKSKIIFIF